ncbi:MAG: 2-oxoglutarate dehydrogenase, E2 component, dihydrolipoamide succinyltransferase [Bacteroidetes bacterium]|nr:2-oxoglutarate dehydrogenase, E2 component, dihydrolipoamide succinyltransferase [Bacteroidota bacterium]
MDIIMPKMGESVSEGTILKWHKKKGDAVKRDEIIFEISTDKVDTEIPSPAEGILSEIRFNEGDTVEVGTVVAVIDANGELKSITNAPAKEIIHEPVVEEIKIEETPKVFEETKSKEEISVSEKSQSSQSSNSSLGAIDILMPKMGESIMEGTIIKWHKKVGEQIKKDETIFEISTDKVDTEVPSPAEGMLSEILVAEQETVEVGTVVARLSVKGQSVKPKNEIKKPVVEVKPSQQVESKTIEVEKELPSSMHENFSSVKASALEANEGINGSSHEGKGTTKFLSPLVLNIARKENVSFDEIDKIKGTGLEGRVTKKDILNYIEQRNNATEPVETKVEEIPHADVEETKHEVVSSPSNSTSKVQAVYSSNEVERIPMDIVRQKIMQHMVNSRDTSVHVSAMLEVDMTRIYNFLKANRDEIQRKQGIKLTYMPFISHACIKALKEFPLVNATIDGTTIVKKKFINLGIAVAMEPNGLIVPNIKNADEKNIIGLAKSINEIAEKARTKKLTPDDITNGTFTITNYGVFGTIFGTPIINQPEVAILGVGTVVKKPVVVEIEGADTIAIKPTMALTLSHDHRLVDGMLGGRFLKLIKDTLESFSANEV